MLIRVFAVIMVMLCGTFCGINYSEKLRKRVIFCSEAEKMMQLCEIMIRSSGTEVYKLVDRLKNENYTVLRFIDELSDSYSADENFREKWSAAVSESRYICDEERRVRTDFGSFLGSTDISGQLDGIAMQLECMHGIFQQRLAEYRQKGRLYRSLGMLAGLTVGIAVI